MKTTLIKSVVAGCTVASLFTAHLAEARPTRATRGAKYVFFFLGDGMASVQMQAAEAYLAAGQAGGEDNATNLLDTANMLQINQMPITGLSTTYAETRFITGSAASATAFACGVKTSIRTIGMSADKTSEKYKSVAELAHEQGKSVGIISSVSLPHATPAAYYANVDDRGEYNEIGYQASQSGFEFFGGGRFRKLAETNNAAGVVLSDAFADAGYVFVDTIADAVAQAEDQKVICSVPFSYGSDAMPYHIDTPEGNFTLSEVTQCAIDRLQNDSDGFFIMVEGGKIDWACHANDPMGAIVDTLEFDNSVAVARAFLAAHPAETLIVVTGDHECGGLSLGYRGTEYETAFATLEGQVKSYEAFIAEDLIPYKENYFTNVLGRTDYEAGFNGAFTTNDWDVANNNIDETLQNLIEANFGLAWSDLSDYQKAQLETAFDRTMTVADNSPSGYDLADNPGMHTVDYDMYGGYEALTITICHILNQESGIHWASTSHTAVPVPVMAEGFDAYRFNGFYDNTDIAKHIAKAMRISAELPVIDND
jgi:alkaline phosphatase